MCKSIAMRNKRIFVIKQFSYTWHDFNRRPINRRKQKRKRKTWNRISQYWAIDRASFCSSCFSVDHWFLIENQLYSVEFQVNSTNEQKWNTSFFPLNPFVTLYFLYSINNAQNAISVGTNCNLFTSCVCFSYSYYFIIFLFCFFTIIIFSTMWWMCEWNYKFSLEICQKHKISCK